MWERVHRYSLIGMNYWASDLATTGELEVLKYVSDQLHTTEKPIIFDVGANIGQFSIACQRIMPGCDLHAFEPSPRTFEGLRRNLVQSSLLHLHNVGFSSETREAELYSSEAAATIASVHKLERPLRPFRDEFTERVQLTTIDSFCEERKLGRIDFLKLDIEGHELNALQGAAALLEAGAIRFIQFEFGENNLSSRTCLSDFVRLLGDRYRISRVTPGGLTAWRYDGGASEVFATMNYFCERRDISPST